MTPAAPPPTADLHLRVRDVWKSYGEKDVLRGVTFDVVRGRINVIIGGSGAGKSVLMRQIVRLETPDAGEIILDGQDIAHLGTLALVPVRRKMGMVFQMSALFDSMSVFDNVAFMLREHTKMRTAEVRERVMGRLADLKVDDAAQKMPSELSGGMKRRVAIARALVLEPELLIYDEPTTGLDPITSRTVDDLIIETGEKAGVTSIVITHDMASVFRIGHVVNYLFEGKVVLTEPPEALRGTASVAMRDFLRASGVTVAGG